MKDYEIKDGKIIRYVPVTPKEALQALADNDSKPVSGFACRLEGGWHEDILIGYDPQQDDHFLFDEYDSDRCARIETIDPRAVPEGVPELPEPWLAFIRMTRDLKQYSDESGAMWILSRRGQWQSVTWSSPSIAVREDALWAIDVRTEFAKEHFPEYVEAVGYVEDRYGYLTTGDPVPAPPEGWEIAEEGIETSFPILIFNDNSMRWIEISGEKGEKITLVGTARAYARRVSTIAKPEPETEDVKLIAAIHKMELNKTAVENARIIWDAAIASTKNDDSEPKYKIGQSVRYKGRIHQVCDVDKGYAYLGLSGDKYISPNHKDNRCISAPMVDCEIVHGDDSELLEFLLNLINNQGVNGLMARVSWSHGQPFSRERIRAAMKGGAE